MSMIETSLKSILPTITTGDSGTVAGLKTPSINLFPELSPELPPELPPEPFPGLSSGLEKESDLVIDTETLSFFDSLQDVPLSLDTPPEYPAEVMQDGNVLPPVSETVESVHLPLELLTTSDNSLDGIEEELVLPVVPSQLLQTEFMEKNKLNRTPLRNSIVESPKSSAPVVLQTEPLVNEADLLMRMQSATTHKTGDLLLQNQLLENSVSGAQPSTNITPHSALLKPPMTSLTVQGETISLPVQTNVPEKLSHPDWGKGMGEKVIWMVNQNIRSAELRLNPAHLGPIEVRIDMDDEQVSIAFSSRHAPVREAMELALPRLREMFDENGLSLADTDISQQSFAEQRENAFGQNIEQNSGFSAGQSKTPDANNIGVENDLNVSDISLIDYYI